MANKIVPQTLNSSGVYDKLITAISSGGTGAESESAAVKNLINGLSSTIPASDDLVPFQDVSSDGAGKTTLSALASALQSVRGYAKIQTGSYVGTGTYGANNPCSLTFSFIPKLILIETDSITDNYWGHYFFIRNNQNHSSWYYYNNLVSIGKNSKWSNKTFSFWQSNSNASAGGQMNQKGTKYFYCGVG